jgi:hypothetical protein
MTFTKGTSFRLGRHRICRTLPDVQIVFAYGNDLEGVRLWSTRNNLLTEEESYVAVGAGEMFARMLLSQFFPHVWPMTTESAILLTAYVIWRVKDVIPSCSKQTTIQAVEHSRLLRVGASRIKEMESVFEDYEELDGRLLAAAFGRDPSAIESVSGEIRALRQRCSGILQRKKPNDFAD